MVLDPGYGFTIGVVALLEMQPASPPITGVMKTEVNEKWYWTRERWEWAHWYWWCADIGVLLD